MAIKKIPCGGFSYDDTEIAFEDGVIHPIGGGGGMMVANITNISDGRCAVDKTYEEIVAAMPNVVLYDGERYYNVYQEEHTEDDVNYVAFSHLGISSDYLYDGVFSHVTFRYVTIGQEFNEYIVATGLND